MVSVPSHEWRGQRVSHLVLGTAQLGQDYGIANDHGRPTPTAARSLIAAAWRQGVTTFDTAQAYGAGEALLGAALGELGAVRDAQVVTKLAPTIDLGNPDAVLAAVRASCSRLRAKSLWGLMLHREQMLDRWQDGLGETLCNLRDQGLVRYLGVSMYTPQAATRALEIPDIDLLQVPCNAWDQRMLTGGILEAARLRDKLCFVRSVYLQGLLTLTPADVAERLPVAVPAATQWTTLAAALHVTPTQLALRFARSLDCPLVIGVETPEQLADNLRRLHEPPLSATARGTLRRRLTRWLTPDLLNPSMWHAGLEAGKERSVMTNKPG